ncbi:hypothetical protein EYF80_032396 [Liparis tanakae]|uniref:Uncharacterized protein n=1 Tax=Liparis tanakae TaxID=230148 RepID=A0A4Z2GVS2_9TELE|nr:hypothetical protein EYF80_032396 [Liparis tanakae]
MFVSTKRCSHWYQERSRRSCKRDVRAPRQTAASSPEEVKRPNKGGQKKKNPGAHGGGEEPPDFTQPQVYLPGRSACWTKTRTKVSR